MDRGGDGRECSRSSEVGDTGGMQDSLMRSGEVIGRYSGGLMSSTIQVRGMLVGRRLDWVIGKYSGHLLSSTVLEGHLR